MARWTKHAGACFAVHDARGAIGLDNGCNVSNCSFIGSASAVQISLHGCFTVVHIFLVILWTLKGAPHLAWPPHYTLACKPANTNACIQPKTSNIPLFHHRPTSAHSMSVMYNKPYKLAQIPRIDHLPALLFSQPCLQRKSAHTMLPCRPFLLQSKASYTQIGIFSVASYPYSFKLLWSPIVDSIYSLAFGRRKSWVVPIQLGSSVILLGSATWLAGRWEPRAIICACCQCLCMLSVTWLAGS